MDHGKLLAVGTPEEVKRLMRGTILEIRTAEARRATAVLRATLPPGSVSLFGDRVHVVTEDVQGAGDRVREALAGSGIETSELRPIEPTLEDVFVSVLGSSAAATSRT